MLPLLAPMLGNDVLKTSNMYSFFAQYDIKRLRPSKGNLSNTHKNIYSALKWLKSQPQDVELVYKKVSCQH